MPATEELKRRVLSMTAAFEGGMDAIAGNFDGQILSFGPLQWNIGQGTLEPILNMIPEKTLVKYLGNEFVEALKEGRLRELALGEILDQGGRVKPLWRMRFQKLAGDIHTQKAFVKGAEDYFRRGEALCRALGFKTERGYALCFDTAVQNGAPRRDHIRKFRKAAIKDVDEWVNLKVFATIVADSADPKWRADVLSRKLTIALGRGWVHGKQYDLERDFGISYHRPWDINPYPCGIERVFLDGKELRVEKITLVGRKLYIRTAEEE